MARMIDDNTKRQLSKRMDFFLKYFPVRVRNVGEDAVAARQLIWAFKDARDNAFEKVAQMTAAHLIKVCGEEGLPEHRLRASSLHAEPHQGNQPIRLYHA